MTFRAFAVAAPANDPELCPVRAAHITNAAYRPRHPFLSIHDQGRICVDQRLGFGRFPARWRMEGQARPL
jgi:hypothetical protein